MKNLIYVLLAIMCSTSTTIAQQYLIKTEMYGIYHNELLDSYTKRYKNNDSDKFMIVYNRFIEEFQRKYPDKLTVAEKRFYKKRIDEIFGSDTTSKNFAPNLIVNTAATSYCSIPIQNIFLDAFLKNEDPAVVISKLNFLKAHSRMFASEINELNKFMILGNASANSCNCNAVTAPESCCACCQSRLATMAGGMFGVAGAAAMSYFVKYIQDRNYNAGCIQ